MPRSGINGNFSLPPNTDNQQPNTPISSAMFNAFADDVEQTFNTPQPIAFGGTNATTAGGAADALSPAFVNVASATTTNIGAATSPNVNITGTTTITAFDTVANGVRRHVTFGGILTLTHNAATLILPGGANITTAAGDTAEIVSLGSGNWKVEDYTKASGQAIAPTPAPPPQKGYLQGLKLVNNVADVVNDIDVGAGEASSDAATPSLMILSATLTKRLDALWVVGNGGGGLDTGGVANGTYHIWLIQRSDTGVVDALFSASATAPTMPTNYDRKRRIGSIIRASAAIVEFRQSGDEFLLYRPVLDVDATSAPGTTAILYTLTVPLGLEVNAIIQFGGYGTSGTPALLVSSTAQADVSVTDGASSPFSLVATSNQWSSNSATIRVDTSGRVRARASQVFTRFKITTFGWIDNRGRV